MSEIQFGFGFIRAPADSDFAVCCAIIGFVAALMATSFATWQARVLLESVLARREFAASIKVRNEIDGSVQVRGTSSVDPVSTVVVRQITEGTPSISPAN